mmetsp:Transcript_42424/g.70664  ORF Transcript_42424/g.70664 Transcript_42424/m.70664 type:complete len:387 (-) Transcript_42424:305-1465(-)
MEKDRLSRWLRRGLWASLLATVCGGLTLALVGCINIAHGLRDERGSRIAQYNAAVEKWSSRGRDRFAAFSAVVSGLASPAVNVVADKTGDWSSQRTLPDGDPAIKREYLPLKFATAFGSSPFPASVDINSDRADLTKWGTCLNVTECTFQLTSPTEDISGPTLVAIPYGQAIEDKSELLVHQKSGRVETCQDSSRHDYKHCDFICKEHGGAYDGNLCHRFYPLLSICIQVTPSSSGWTASDHRCFSQEITLPAPPTGVGLYMTQPIDPTTAEDAFPLAAMSVVIRSSEDPILVADSLTEGTFYFGPSVGQKCTRGVILLIGGLSALVLPLVLAVYVLRPYLFDGYEAPSPVIRSSIGSNVPYQPVPLSDNKSSNDAEYGSFYDDDK